jgi:hypothetical protein
MDVGQQELQVEDQDQQAHATSKNIADIINK